MATTTSGQTTITINANGTAFRGVNAEFNVLVDGQIVGTAWTTSSAKDYTFTTDALLGTGHLVEIQYINDAHNRWGDRNLFINDIHINGVDVAPTSSIVTYDKGALDGVNVVPGQSAMYWNGTLVVNADSSFFPAATTSTTTSGTTSTGSTSTGSSSISSGTGSTTSSGSSTITSTGSTSTSTSTSSTTPTTTTTTSSTGTAPFFGPHAPWNVAATNLATDPNSANLVNMLWYHGSDRAGNFNLDATEGFALYSSANATGWYNVNISWGGSLNGQTIPWNPAWQIPTGTDQKVIVLDPATGREWDLFQTSFDGTTVHASNGSLVPGNYFTYEGGNPPSRGAGIEYLAMLVTAQELAQGQINHALALNIDNTDGSTFVAPATKLEHPGNPAGIPEGTRFVLTVTDAQEAAWEHSLPTNLQAIGHTIATALRNYGWFITDTTGGASSFEFESVASGANAYHAMGITGTQLTDGTFMNLLDGLLSPTAIRAIVPPGANGY